jgi:hypothetical protein
MISAIISILSSSGFGAILGTVGAFFTRAQETKKQKLDHDFQIAMAKLNLEESKLDREHELAIADKERKQAETEGEISKELIDAESFKESVISSRVKSGIKIIDGIRALMRPVIAIYLLVISTMVAIDISLVVGGIDSFDHDKLFILYSGIISDLSFLTMTAVTWWFGTRNINRK